MRTLARFLVRHARPVLAATAVLTLVAAGMLTRLAVDADVASFLLDGNPTGEEFAALQEEYDTGDPIIAVATLDGDATFRDPARLADLRRLALALDDVAGTASVASVLPDEHPLTGAPLTPDVVAALPPMAVERVLAEGPASQLLVAPDATAAMLVVTAADDAVAVARGMAEVEPPAGMAVSMAGNPVVFATVLDSLGWFLVVVPPLVIAAMVLVFALSLGERRLALLAIVPAALGSLWTFGLIFGLGREIDIVTVIVPIFVIVMGSADGLHFMAHAQEAAARGLRGIDLVESTLRHVGIPMILTTVSTAAGFLSLLATGVQPIEELGVFAAIGITFAGIISLLALPALLSRLTLRGEPGRAVLGVRVTRALARLTRTRVPAVVTSAVLVTFVAVFLPRLEVDADQLFFFRADDPVRTAFADIEEAFGAATPLFGEVAFDPTADPVEELAAARAASDDLAALPGIRRVFSVADVVEDASPDRRDAVLAGEVDLPLGRMVSDDGLRLVVFPDDASAANRAAWQEAVAADPRIEVLTGMPVVWDEIARLVVRSQVVSLAVAFVLVAVLLGAAYRRVRETLVSLVPIALTVAVLLAFLAASGIDLNLLTAVLSSIVIGVGIDYSIHLVAAINLERAEGRGHVQRGVAAAGRPIVANALGIAVGMSALWVSPLAIHPQISAVMWVSMTVAALAALLLIPALLGDDRTVSG